MEYKYINTYNIYICIYIYVYIYICPEKKYATLIHQLAYFFLGGAVVVQQTSVIPQEQTRETGRSWPKLDQRYVDGPTSPGRRGGSPEVTMRGSITLNKKKHEAFNHEATPKFLMVYKRKICLKKIHTHIWMMTGVSRNKLRDTIN